MNPYAVAPEQWPVPCNRCGASLRMTGQPSPYGGAVMMACPFCQAVEHLPAEASERVRVAHERVALLRMAMDAAEAPARAMDALMRRKPWIGGMVVGGVMGLNMVSSLVGNRASLERAGATMAADDRWKLMFQSWAMGLGGIGFALGGYVGWWLALKSYRAAVEPTTWARPPLTPQGAARCRCCGADLVMQWGATVTCGYCNTQNVLSRELIDRRDALLSEETFMHQQRAAGVIQRGNVAHQNFSRWWWVGGLAGAGAMVALAALLASVG